MQVDLCFVQTGNSLILEMPTPPHPGDLVSISLKGGEHGTEDYTVKRVSWQIEAIPGSAALMALGQPKPISAKLTSAMVECEHTLTAHSSESHKKACKTYTNKRRRKK